MRGSLQQQPNGRFLGVGAVARAHWQSRLSGYEQRKLLELIRRSGGHLGVLSDRDRRQLADLIGQLDLPDLVRAIAAYLRTGSPPPPRPRGR